MKSNLKLKKASNLHSPSSDFKHLPPIGGGNFANETEKHVDDLKSGQSNILVAVRVRPLSSKEVGYSNFETLKVIDGKCVLLLDPANQFDANDVFRNNRNKEKQYAFDYAFGQEVDTVTVFENTTKFLIPGVLNGFNATVFAYGATGAGKTHTMLGTSTTPGIMYLTMGELFKEMRNHSDKSFVVKVSYLEVYNETLRDLLSEEENIVDIREDNKGIVVSGITEVTVSTPGEVMNLLSIGSKNRTMEATGANVVSSRSHAVLQAVVEHREKNQGINEEITTSKLSLIDLAGSERASATNNTGQRMIEGANINKSLLALGNCITLLSDRNEGKGKNISHIPYRDSKLTRLLKDSLGGNCRTVMITNLSPAVTTFEDTHNTLKYANRAKNIKTSVSRNVLQVENHMEKYSQIISDLKQENTNLKHMLSHGSHGGNHQPPQQLQQMRGFNEAGGSLGIPVKDPSTLDHKDLLASDIREHFETEIGLKKKFYESQLQYDEYEERINILSNSEQYLHDDPIQKAKYEEMAAALKRLALTSEEAQRDYSLVSAKRNFLQARIQKEKNKDTIAFLVNLLKHNIMIIDNMDLLHREKRIENQVKLKDRQLQFLQNRLSHKGGKNKESPSRSSAAHSRIGEDLRIQSDLLEDSASFLNELHDLERGGSVKSISQAKHVFHLPHINPKVGHGSTTQASRKILPTSVKRLDLATNMDHYGEYQYRKLTRSTQSVHNSKAPSNFYYNKHDYLVDRQRPFDGSQSDRAKNKKKVGGYNYVPFQTRMKRDILASHSGRGIGLTEHSVDPPNRKGRSLAVSTSPRRNNSARSLTNMSYASNASSNKAEHRKNILRDLNMKSEGGPGPHLRTLKLRAINRQGKVAMRYGASPYVNGMSGGSGSGSGSGKFGKGAKRR